MQICSCPAAAALTTIPAAGCPETFGQIQKIAFQRLKKADGTVNKFSSSNDIKLKASWTALMAAADGGKIVISPYVQAPTNEAGAARTFGGGNETLNGIEMVVGSNPINVTCRLNGKKQDIIAALKSLECEALSNNLGVYAINEKGQIEGIKEGRDWYPAPIQKFYVSDKKHGDFDGPDYNDMSFSYAPGYSDSLDVITLDQSALQL